MLEYFGIKGCLGLFTERYFGFVLLYVLLDIEHFFESDSFLYNQNCVERAPDYKQRALLDPYNL